MDIKPDDIVAIVSQYLEDPICEFTVCFNDYPLYVRKLYPEDASKFPGRLLLPVSSLVYGTLSTVITSKRYKSFLVKTKKIMVCEEYRNRLIVHNYDMPHLGLRAAVGAIGRGPQPPIL